MDMRVRSDDHPRCWLAGLPILVFVVSFAAISVIFHYSENASQEVEQKRTLAIVAEYASGVKSAMDHTLSMTYAMSALVQQGNGRIENFDGLVAKMLPMYPGAAAFQLAPNGIVSQCYPLEGNEKIIGHDLFLDPHQAAEARLTRDSGNLFLAGPYSLIQGGQGGLGRLPVFLVDEAGNSVFWGFVTILLHYPDVFANIGLERLEQNGYAYEIWCDDFETGERETIVASQTPLRGKPIDWEIAVPGHPWMLSVTPISTQAAGSHAWLRWVMGLLVCSLLSWVAHLILQLQERASRLRNMALVDDLTQLPNRHAIMSSLAKAQKEVRKSGKMLAVGYFDIDNFKAVNDNFGHDAGDEVLRCVAQRVRLALPEQHFLGRLGGDEFLFVLNDVQNIWEAVHITQDIYPIVTRPIMLSGQERSLAISIGITLYPLDAVSPELLVQHADHAMYEAKKSGKSRWHIYGS